MRQSPLYEYNHTKSLHFLSRFIEVFISLAGADAAVAPDVPGKAISSFPIFNKIERVLTVRFENILSVFYLK